MDDRISKLSKDDIEFLADCVEDIRRGRIVSIVDLDAVFSKMGVPLGGDRWTSFIECIARDRGLSLPLDNESARLIRFFVKYATIRVLNQVAGIRACKFEEEEDDG